MEQEEYVDSVEKDVGVVDDKKSKQELYLEQLRKAKELSQKAKEDFKKSDYKLLNHSAYKKFDTVVSMLCNNVSIAGMIYSKGGLGKSHRVKQLLSDKSVNYEIVMTKLTAKALYCLLYEYRDADLIWFDDVTRIMKDPLILGFLKSACGDGNSIASKKRMIQYNVSTPIRDAEGQILPSEFEISARILITTNEMPNGKNGNADLGAVLSRIKKAKLVIKRPELITMLEEITLEPYADLSSLERVEVLEFIKNNTSDDMDNLNLRILFDGFDYRRIAKIDRLGEQWKQNILDDLEIDDSIVALEKILKDPNFYSEPERMDAFNRYLVENHKSPISKPTYHRMKAKLVERGVKPADYKVKEEVVVPDELPDGTRVEP